ncbi:putative DNA-binding domain-containing protein [Leucothrix arctica]|uniref:Putative DNA-binding domain-containing protein n=1 Tax=Leucothrix arctica TaxID=1481894 RepID=A0A317CC03_9GAMM|nr:putative DNA-binding domain-containing protein [Leucothrix arctica]PWQ96154.1 hypothetical protein DKT75_09155 [Leucothrix arctica]
MNKHSISPFSLAQQEMSAQIYAGDEAYKLDDWRCSDRIPKALALDIYQRNLHGGVAQHLQAHFPVTNAYIGTQGYQFICAEYLKESPPERPLFTLYAAHFPGFLLEYGEQRPQQAIWSVSARLAQIDFFHHNAFCEDQRIQVEACYYQLWITLKALMDSGAEATELGLYQRLDLHPELYQDESEYITLVTFWKDDELFFMKEAF